MPDDFHMISITGFRSAIWGRAPESRAGEMRQRNGRAVTVTVTGSRRGKGKPVQPHTSLNTTQHNSWWLMAQHLTHRPASIQALDKSVSDNVWLCSSHCNTRDACQIAYWQTDNRWHFPYILVWKAVREAPVLHLTRSTFDKGGLRLLTETVSI